VTWRAALKRTLIGKPFATHEQDEQLLPKRLALPLFASDPLSSVAYATEEIMLVLVAAGTVAFSRMIPISLAIGTLVVIVVTSYRQTVRAYPQGGGAYLVTRDNLGLFPALVAASALLSDYVLTVAVSVAAGVAAVTSAFPGVIPWKVVLSVFLVVLLALANLRGVKETGRMFAVPTYLFFVTVMAMLITGFVRCLDGTCPQAESATMPITPELGGVGLFLILRAFASGSTALTGIEAIADGVPAFRRPKSHNAATTLAVMAAMSISMFLGITVLARLFEVRVTEATLDETGSVISQIGRTAFDGGVMFFVLQLATVGILVLAANTAYQDFPRLSAILARDRLMPRQLRNQGDRLVFSNGIVLLSGLAIVLLLVFQANLTRLIQLYVVGVFTSFTLSQTAMVRRWLRERSPGWHHRAVLNAIGATTTGVVLVVVASVKFTRGAWIVITAIPILVFLMWRVRAHYEWVAAQLSVLRPHPPVERRIRTVVLASTTTPAISRALRFAELSRPVESRCVHVTEGAGDTFRLDWLTVFRDVPLTVIEARKRRIVEPLRAYLRGIREKDPSCMVVVLVPELARGRTVLPMLLHRNALRIKRGLLFERRVIVTDLMLVPDSLRRPGERPVAGVTRRHMVIPVGGVTQATLRAVEYARAVGPDRMVALHADVDQDYGERVRAEWEANVRDIPLEILSSPFRSTIGPILKRVREIRDAAPTGTIVEVVLPEFVVPNRVGRILHNRTAFALKLALLYEVDVAVTSCPWHLIPETEAYEIREIRSRA
jgi:amino acid transporter